MEVKQGEKYQWIKGEYMGDLETVHEVNDSKVRFDSKRVLMLTVFEEFMKPIKTDADMIVMQKVGAVVENSNQVAAATPAKDPNDLLISNSKIVDAINLSKKSKVLNFKAKVKYLDPALYEFLESAHDNFDAVYKQMIIQQVTADLENQIDEFLTNVYKKED